MGNSGREEDNPGTIEIGTRCCYTISGPGGTAEFVGEVVGRASKGDVYLQTEKGLTIHVPQKNLTPLSE